MTLQPLCPECDEPVAKRPIQMTGGANWLQCPRCGHYFTPDKLKLIPNLISYRGDK